MGITEMLKCGASDHVLKDCPQWRQPTQRRVFTMQTEEANSDMTLLTGLSGNIFIKRVATKALIVSGATYSFISETFANQLDFKSIGLDVSYSVTVPSREELSTTSVVRDIDLQLQGHLVYADLIVLPMPEFVIILGIDWLTNDKVLIDFQKRSVLVRPLGMEQFPFEPDRWRSFPRMISCMQAQRLIHKGCQALLASMISKPDVPTPSISYVPIVRDFPDVFPDDVIGLSPEREVEFAIDFVQVLVVLSSNDDYAPLYSSNISIYHQ
ncbi:uncharacterized protein [Primulina eburnea]|uniref:uncharacterized protein n=1 Tax=Primulina eburnea TaxID=1245227 RepID=UPI003C6CC484